MRRRHAHLHTGRHAQPDAGFTLVELLISVALIGLIAAAIGGALIVALTSIDTTKQQLTATNARNLVSEDLVADVQSSTNLFDELRPAPTSPTSCDATLIPEFQRTVVDATGVQQPAYISYSLQEGASSRCNLVRTETRCVPDGLGGNTCTPSERTIVHGLRADASVTTDVDGKVLTVKLATADEAPGEYSFQISASSRTGTL